MSITDWFAVTVRGAREHIAASFLNTWNLYAMAPRIEQIRTYKKRAPDCITVPLFPGYIFAKGESDHLKQAITAMRQRHIPNHIRGVISIDNQPVPVDSEFITYLLTEGGPQHVLRIKKNVMTDCPYHPGDLVTFLNGPAEGKTASFVRMTADERVVLLISILGRKVEVPALLESIALTTWAESKAS